MSDKKVERNVRSSDEERPATPMDKLQASLSKDGNVNMADKRHDKAKAALLDRFRAREERYRQDQAIHARTETSFPESEESEPENLLRE